MVYYPVERLVEAGVHDILIVTGVHHVGAIVHQLGSGAEFGARFTYKVQDEAGGIAEALGLAEDFARGGSVAVVLGDNLFTAPLRPHLQRWESGGKGAYILLKAVDDPCRFGVARFDGGRLVEVVEKPMVAPSPFAVTGIYFYDSKVFGRIATLCPSARGELEISDVNSWYLANQDMDWAELDGPWTDAGTHESYRRANLIF